MKSDGSTAEYYQLPEGAKELQDLISHRNLNAQDGEIFRSIYRKGLADHSSELRDARKVLFYAREEVRRLEKLEMAIPNIRRYNMMCFRDTTWCSYSYICDNQSCTVIFNDYHIKACREWWGKEGAPVAYANFKTDECGYVKK